MRWRFICTSPAAAKARSVRPTMSRTVPRWAAISSCVQRKGPQRASHHVPHRAQVGGDLLLRPALSDRARFGLFQQKARQPPPHRAQ